MRKYLCSLMLLGCVVSLSAQSHQGASGSLPHGGTAAEQFTQRSYQQAVAAYEAEIESQGATLARLVNLGNSYYQVGNLGRAVLNYERAHLLAPSDQGVQQTRDYLQSQTLDKLPETTSWIRSVGGRIAYALPLPAYITISLVSFTLFIGLLVAFSLAPQRSRRRLYFYLALVVLVPTLLSGASILHWLYEDSQADMRLVLLSPEVKVYGSEQRESAPIQTLHEGARLTAVGNKRGSMIQIELPSGKAAWIQASDLAFVRP